MKRIPELDGLRGLAILLVLLWHCVGAQMDPNQDWSRQVLACLNLAWTGVDLFFVLSGFLIGGILLDHGAATNFFQVFYARRALRILPPYVLLLISYVVAKQWSANVPGTEELFVASPPLWVYGSFLQNFAFAQTGRSGTPWLSATWSLSVEEQFYLCLPVVMFLVPRAQLWQWLLGLIVAAPLFRILFYELPPVPGYAVYLLTPGRADALLLGVLGAWLMRHAPARDWLHAHGRWLRAVMLILLVGAAVLHQSYVGYISLEMMSVGYTWLALFYSGLVLTAVTTPQGLVASLARVPPLRYLGTISYGLYLIHMPVSALVFAALTGHVGPVRGGSDAWAMLAALVASVTLAALSWHLLEARLVRYGHGFPYRFAEPPREPGQSVRIFRI